MRSALRAARAWLADVLIPAPLAMSLVQVGEQPHEQDGDADA